MNKTNPFKRHKARQLGLQALYQLQLSNNDPQEIAENSISSPLYKNSDKEYFAQIFHGVVDNLDEINGIIGGINKNGDINIDPIMRSVLQIGVYELKHCPELDYAIIINEAVLLCNEFLHKESHAFANSILEQAAVQIRSIQAKSGKTADPSIAADKTHL